MKFISIFFLFTALLLQLVVTAQTSEQNYIRTFDVQLPGITLSELNLNTPASTAAQTIQYFDGLGRPVQTVQVGAAPDGSDMIKPVKYNEVGLDEWNFLPYPSLTEKGSYREGFEQAQTLFYNETYGNNSPGLSPIEYEKSPLNRVLKQGSPGADWQLDATGHFVSFSYLSNTNSDPKLSAKLWKVNGTTCESTGNYENNQLYVNKTVGENEAETYEFKDKQGQVVLKRSILGTDILVDTYYVYDDFGLLRFVISPEGSAQITGSFTATSTLAKQYVYCYTYDARKRLIEKQIPGKEPEYYVYNNNDQVILYQDGNMRKLNGSTPAYEWQFTKYDALGRVIMTGVTTQYPNESQQTLQTFANNYSGKCWEILYSNSTTRPDDNNFYTNQAFPVLPAKYLLYTLNYYDTYHVTLKDATTPILICDKTTLKQPGTTAAAPTTSPAISQVCGFPTVNYVLFEAQGLSLATLTYYDKYGRTIRVGSEHHLDGYDLNTMEYMGLTKLMTSNTHLHFAKRKKLPPYDYTYAKQEDFAYTYDHAGRQINLRYSLNSSPVVQVISNSYNRLGQLKSKQIGDGNYLLQKVDYKYNIKGWLTWINDPSNVSATGDLFGMQLMYDTINTQLNNIPAYNGNISGIRWQTAQPTGITTPVTTGEKAYRYLYDNMNRLLTGEFYEIPANGSALYQTDRYSEFIHTGSQAQGYKPYDLNGNIKTINRFGMKAPNNSPGLIDQLTYYYKGNQLIGVNDQVTTNNVGDFFDNNQIAIPNPADPATWEYTYDANGNLTKDRNKGILSIAYNTLNLPTSINKSGGLRVEYQYDAAGSKRRQVYYTNIEGNLSKTTDFVGNFVYENGVPVYNIYDEGRIVFNADGSCFGEAFVKDHLGNVRVACRLEHGQVKVRQVNSYYPFGMNIKGLSQNSTDTYKPNEYLYNGKMMQDEMGLGLLDYGARMYDAVLGRWHTPDRFSEKYFDLSPYQYAANNPIRNVDINGDSIWATINTNITNPDGTSGIQTTRYHYGQDANGNYGFIDGCGNLYSGNNTFVNQLSSALGDLRSESTGRSVVDELAGSSKNTEIVYGSKNAANEQDGSYIRWNPNSIIGGPDQSGTNTPPAFIGLGHEMAHVQDIWNGTIDRSEWTSGIPRAEIYSTHVENQIRSEHGVALRTHYAINTDGTPHAGTRILNSKGASIYYNQTNTYDFTPDLILGATPPPKHLIISVTTPYTY